MALTLKLVAGSHRGRVRERNEDQVMIHPEHDLAILSDGMGGHLAGHVASRLAVDTITEHIAPNGKNGPDPVTDTLSKSDIKTALQKANQLIRREAKQNPDQSGMGATVVVASFKNERLLAAHLGDSRLYRFRDNKIVRLTDDHTLAQEYLQEGIFEEGDKKNAMYKNMLTRGLGIERKVNPSFVEEPLQAGDVYLLCSDGLTDAVTDETISRILMRALTRPRETVTQLIREANKNGGPDNISVIIACVIRTSE